mmetsp:Transcript_1532/g.4618  ORF Transcript_1532/g.4618 Transcript_1532/m.4618 type:complete len:216 (-) Transcript_1532:852-1499(-)
MVPAPIVGLKREAQRLAHRGRHHGLASAFRVMSEYTLGVLKDGASPCQSVAEKPRAGRETLLTVVPESEAAAAAAMGVEVEVEPDTTLPLMSNMAGTLGCQDRGMLRHVPLAVHAVEVHTSGVGAVVPHRNAVRIQHWNDEKDVTLQECRCVQAAPASGQSFEHALKHVRGGGLARVHPCTEEDCLPARENVRAQSLRFEARDGRLPHVRLARGP